MKSIPFCCTNIPTAQDYDQPRPLSHKHSLRVAIVITLLPPFNYLLLSSTACYCIDLAKWSSKIQTLAECMLIKIESCINALFGRRATISELSLVSTSNLTSFEMNTKDIILHFTALSPYYLAPPLPFSLETSGPSFAVCSAAHPPTPVSNWASPAGSGWLEASPLLAFSSLSSPLHSR
jgi:hypothetical protein